MIISPPAWVVVGQTDYWATWSKAAYLIDLETHFVTRGKDVTGTVRISGDDAFWKKFTDGEKTRTVGGKLPVPTGFIRVTVTSKPGKAVWTTLLPIRGRVTPFTVPARVLPKLGEYQVSLSLVAGHSGILPVPAGRRIGDFDNEFDSPPTITFSVVAPRNLLLTGTITDASNLLRGAVRVGDPNHARFPKEDGGDCYARGVKDLFAYRNRLFVGCGDWGANRGPIDIWAYSPPEGAGGTGEWTKEFTVDDESIDFFREWYDRLYVPGIDAREDFSFGNVYSRENGHWTKWRTVPRAVHVLDIAGWQGALYACGGVVEDGENGDATAGLFMSRDGGHSWTRCWKSSPEVIYAFRFWRVVPLGDRLIVFDNYVKQGLWEWDGVALRHRAVDLLPGSKNAYYATTIENAHAFAGGILYTLASGEHQFYFLGDTKQGALQCPLFNQGSGAVDISVEEDTCYLLKRHRVGDAWEGEIYSTKDLHEWTRLAVFPVPGPPTAVARLNGTFYVGIGADRTNPTAGTVWRIE